MKKYDKKISETLNASEIFLDCVKLICLRMIHRV